MNTAMKSPAALHGWSGVRIELQAGEYTADQLVGQLAGVDQSGIGSLEVAYTAKHHDGFAIYPFESIRFPAAI